MRPEIPPADVVEFIRLGLAGLIDEIPGLIRNARLLLGKNDIALEIFVDPDGKKFASTAKHRRVMRLELQVAGELSAKMLRNFDPQPPTEVPVLVRFRDHLFAFDFILQGTEGVLS